MKIFFTTIVSVAILFSITSCGENYTNEIGHVDGLIKILDASEEVLNDVDTATLFEMTSFIQHSIKKIQSKGDTLTKEAAIEADQYIGKLKTLYNLAKNYKAYKNEIKNVRQQLNNLKQDLNNGLIPKDKFPAYYENEQNGVILINDKINHATNGMSARLEKMKTKKADFEKLIDDPTSYTSYYKNNSSSN